MTCVRLHTLPLLFGLYVVGVAPALAQTPLTQGPPPLQVLPAQQTCPALPQAWLHMALLQKRPVAQKLPEQQGAPTLPQVEQEPALQTLPALQVPPPQQGCAEPPQTVCTAH